jgi:hypothetical protein
VIVLDEEEESDEDDEWEDIYHETHAQPVVSEVKMQRTYSGVVKNGRFG